LAFSPDMPDANAVNTERGSIGDANDPTRRAGKKI
jgi:hypothetical protein